MLARFYTLRRNRTILLLVSLALLASGLFTLLNIALSIHDRLAQEAFQIVQETTIALILIYLSTSILRRVYSAWLLAIIVISGDVIFSVGFDIVYQVLDISSLYWIILEVIMVLLLWYIRPQFTKRSEAIRVSRTMYIALGLFVLSLAYGTIGHMMATQTPLLQAAGFTALNAFYTFSELPPGLDAERILLSTQALTYVSVAIVMFELLKPLVYRALHSSDDKASQVRTLLEQYGGSSEDYFKLWPADKEYLFNSSHNAAIAYKVTSRIAIAVGDPIGNRRNFSSLIDSYKALCTKYSLQPVFLHTTDTLLDLYKRQGFKAQKLGEEAVVDIQTFITTTARNKKWRNVNNRFAKSGHELTIHHPPHSDTLLEELRRISDEWLETPGRKERGFVLGYFDKAYLNTCAIGVLRNSEAQIVGFVNLVDSYDKSEANIDLFRQRSNAQTNTNDFMMSQLIIQLNELGYARLNLGLCPLVGLDDNKKTSPLDTLLTLVYAHGDKLYSFKGLHQFKSKFDPIWRDRYLIYEDTLALPIIGRAINKAMDLKET